MKFGGKTPSVSDRMKAAEKRGYDTGNPSKGKAPVSAKPKVTVRPSGGLKNLTKGPQGFKAKAEWKF